MKEIIKPVPAKIINVTRIFVNKRNNQMTIIIPRKKLKGFVPKRLEVLCYGDN